jgi:Ca2+-binding EF-hand superfamily protein
MGCSVTHFKPELSIEAREEAIQTFTAMDENRSQSIDQQETSRWFSKTKFAKLTAKAMFESVDVDRNGEIDLDEWLSYWTQVRASGVSDEDIIKELRNIKKRKPWVGFTDVVQAPTSTKD